MKSQFLFIYRTHLRRAHCVNIPWGQIARAVCVQVCDCEIFLAFLFVLPVSGADIDQGGDDSLAMHRSSRMLLLRWLLPTWKVEPRSAFHRIYILIVQALFDSSCVFMHMLVCFFFFLLTNMCLERKFNLELIVTADSVTENSGDKRTLNMSLHFSLHCRH